MFRPDIAGPSAGRWFIRLGVGPSLPDLQASGLVLLYIHIYFFFVFFLNNASFVYTFPNKFLVYVLIRLWLFLNDIGCISFLERWLWFIFGFFLILYRLFLILIFYKIFNICSFAIFFLYIYCSINFMCVSFYYKLILIEKFIKHDQVNYLCCDVRYLYLYFSLGFLNSSFFYLLFMIFFVINLHNVY